MNNIIKLFQDYKIDHTMDHQHCTNGWVNIHCPFCTGSKNYHIGYNPDGNYFNCWRCGKHTTIETLSQILNISKNEAKELQRKYDLQKGQQITTKEPTVKINKVPFKLPTHQELTKPYIKYLRKRQYNPEKLAQFWDIRATGIVSILDGVNYKHRLLFPIYWDNKIVTYQTRDITDKNPYKYIACTKEREIIHHKNILYGRQDLWSDTGICVEGVFDVLRFGPIAFATFGTSFTFNQLKAIKRNNFKRVFVIFDPEREAQKKARKLISNLKLLQIRSEKIMIPTDPGDLSQDDADYIVRDLQKNLYFI